MAGEFGLTQIDQHQDCPMTQVLISFASLSVCKQASSTQCSPAEHTKNQVHDKKSSKHNHGDKIDKLP